jgi:diguanylate cyclase (GGDEF)-like protein/PAS domain S-box-containing protein
MESGLESQSHQCNRYKYIIENIKDIIWEMNKDFVFTFTSPNVKVMTGYEVEEVVGRKITDLLTEESKKYFYDQVNEHLNNRINGTTEKSLLHDVQFICKNGSIKWLEVSANPMFEDGKFIGYIGTTRDIMEKKEYEYQLNQYVQELKTKNVELEKTAMTDVLTGVYNRRKFEDDLDLLINKEKKQDIPFSLILFDIDHFKTINDLFGHNTGDLVLKRISNLVLENIRSNDRLFRWGGEEFIIILSDANMENARKVAEKLREMIENEDFGVEQKITISIGVSEYEYTPNENTDQIFSKIDKILYQAKLQGGNRVTS